jgi:hypothetical protein
MELVGKARMRVLQLLHVIIRPALRLSAQGQELVRILAAQSGHALTAFAAPHLQDDAAISQRLSQCADARNGLGRPNREFLVTITHLSNDVCRLAVVPAIQDPAHLLILEEGFPFVE